MPSLEELAITCRLNHGIYVQHSNEENVLNLSQELASGPLWSIVGMLHMSNLTDVSANFVCFEELRTA